MNPNNISRRHLLLTSEQLALLNSILQIIVHSGNQAATDLEDSLSDLSKVVDKGSRRAALAAGKKRYEEAVSLVAKIEEFTQHGSIYNYQAIIVPSTELSMWGINEQTD